MTFIKMLKDDSGASAAEYALILAIVGAEIAFAAIFLGDAIALAVNDAATCINSNGSTCNGTYKWKQAHDSSNPHSAVLTWKTRSLRVAGPDLINSLP